MDQNVADDVGSFFKGHDRVLLPIENLVWTYAFHFRILMASFVLLVVHVQVLEEELSANEVVVGKANVHPETVEGDSVKIPFLSKLWKNVLLQARRNSSNAVVDEHVCVEEIDAGISLC